MTAPRSIRVIVALLFLGPALVLALGDKPSRFGFQMYSGYGEVTAVWEARGTLHEVDLAQHVASHRTEVDWVDFLPEQLCERLPDAESVTVTQTRPGDDDRRRVTC